MRPTPLRCIPLFALLLACGPSPGADDTAADTAADTGEPDPTAEPTGGPLPATLEDACAELFARRVEFDLRCLGTAPTDAAAYIDACVAIAGAPGSALEIADIAACTAHLVGDACLAYGPWPSCVGEGRNLLYPDHDRPGTRPPGAPCMTGLQCDSAYCSSTYGSDCGQCQRIRVRGETCTDPSDLCIDSDCVAGICDLLGTPLGGDCIDYGGGDCQPDLYCRPLIPDQIEGICTARGDADAACETSRQCAAGLYCAAGACAAQVADGEPCPTGGDGCAGGYCTQGVCGLPAAGRAEGEDCTNAYCQPHLSCDDNVCTVPLRIPLGGACPPYSGDCEQDTYCTYECIDGDCSPGVCTDMPGLGDHCTPQGTCGHGAACIGFSFDPDSQPNGTCVPLGAAGDPCPCGDQLKCTDDLCAPYDPAVCG